MGKGIDLHIHTICSDGTLSPKEVVDKAKEKGISVIAIADHDTVEAYTPELLGYAKEQGIKLIPVVEISTKMGKNGLHILGYNIDFSNDDLLRKLNSLRNARHDYLNNVAKKLIDLGYTLNVLELDKIAAVTKAHIALDIINNGKNKDLLLKEFGHIPDKGEFIETVMNEGCLAYVVKDSITPVAAADLIRKAGGKVVLAHPVAYRYEDKLTSYDILQIIKDMRADGIEANYIYIDKNNKKINEVAFWNSFAEENNLMATIGSDFHIENGIYPEIGLLNEEIYLSEKDLNLMVNWLEKN